MTNDEGQRKSEVRSPKSDGNPKWEVLPGRQCSILSRVIRYWRFGFPSGFGFRYSDFFRHLAFVIRHSLSRFCKTMTIARTRSRQTQKKIRCTRYEYARNLINTPLQRGG